MNYQTAVRDCSSKTGWGRRLCWVTETGGTEARQKVMSWYLISIPLIYSFFCLFEVHVMHLGTHTWFYYKTPGFKSTHVSLFVQICEQTSCISCNTLSCVYSDDSITTETLWHVALNYIYRFMHQVWIIITHWLHVTHTPTHTHTHTHTQAGQEKYVAIKIMCVKEHEMHPGEINTHCMIIQSVCVCVCVCQYLLPVDDDGVWRCLVSVSTALLITAATETNTE